MKVEMQIDREDVMLRMTAYHSNVVWQAELMLAKFIRDQVIRAQGRYNEGVKQRKSTCAWSCTFQIYVKLSTEAVVGSEDVHCVSLGYARACQRDDLSIVLRKGHEIHAQAKVRQEHLRCKFQ
jgi:hypothetical protein